MRSKLLIAVIIGIIIFSASAACAYNTVTIIFDGLNDALGNYNYEVTQFTADLAVGGTPDCDLIRWKYFTAAGITNRFISEQFGNESSSPFSRPLLGASSYPSGTPIPNWYVEEQLSGMVTDPNGLWAAVYTTGLDIYMWDPASEPAPLQYPNPPYAKDGVFMVLFQTESEQWGLDPSSFHFYDRTSHDTVEIPGTEYCVSSIWVDADARWGLDGEKDQIITITFGQECPAVPIPPSALLLASGVIGLIWTRKRTGRR